MSGFYYQTNLKTLDLNKKQLRKIREYIRGKVRDMAAIDSGAFLRSLFTEWNPATKILTVGSRLYYSGYIEGGNVNYTYHRDKIGKTLRDMGLNITTIKYYPQ